MNKEIRSIAELPILLRSEDGAETRTLEGYAVVFESRSEYMGFYETISRGAITEELINNSDVVMCYNHDPSQMLARSRNGEGTLHLELDDHGLKFRFDVPNTSLGNDVLELVKRGDLAGCSFAFAVDPSNPNAEKWEEGEDGVLHRYIHEIAGLYDCSVVTYPAYPDTDVQARAQKAQEEIDEAKRQAEIAAEEQRVNALNEKHDALLAEIETW